MINFKENICNIELVELGPLKSVSALPNGLDDGGYDVIHLNFANQTVELTYHIEFDTIEMRCTDYDSSMPLLNILQKSFIEDDFTNLSWYHLMHNNLNYIDGLQFQFSNGKDGKSIQFYVSSSIYIYELLQMK